LVILPIDRIPKKKERLKPLLKTLVKLCIRAVEENPRAEFITVLDTPVV
jgi:hypothetical protein